MKKTKVIVLSFVFLFLVLGFTGAWLYFRLTPYPELDNLIAQKYSCRIYDRDNQILQITTLDEGLRQEFTPLNQIPKQVQQIFISSEDQRFYFHNGVDWLAAVTAAFQNYTSKRTVRGASTITMQLAKIAEPVEYHSFSRKIQDVINAHRIEARLSKKEILELYLNSVPFGMNVNGVTSAARSIYGKNLNELTFEETCCLSVIPRRPASYNPLQHPQECAEMADLIAKRFKKNDKEAILNAARSAKAYTYPFEFPHYLINLQKTQPELFNSYEAHLPVSLKYQKKAESFLREALDKAAGSRISNGALLLIDNKTGEILSWLGNGNWFDSANHGQIDGVLVKNQPGSAMKPFLYALAFDTFDDHGYPLYYPSKIIADVPTEFGSTKLYIPANFNNQFNGPIRTRIALASSLNIPAVTILNELGVDAYLNKLYELGFDSLHQGGKEADLGLSLGAGEITLKELVTAFSVFPRDGMDFSGNQIYTKDTARLICSILSDKGARSLGFGYSQTFQTDYPSIFKTGTSNQYQNITAVGATTDFTIGVWMGNFEGQTVVGKTGSSLPAWVAKNVLDFIERDNHPNEFPEPENWSQRKICSLSGNIACKDCPATVFEFVKNDFPLGTCSWHSKSKITGNLETNLPAEYQSWVRRNKINVSLEQGPLTILTPKNNSVYFYSSNTVVPQAISVEVSGGSSDVLRYKYDSKPAVTVSRPFLFQLPVEVGKHKCTVTCNNETKTINFEVK